MSTRDLNMLRVVVVNDSATMRMALRASLEDESDIEVVGEARDGVEAIEVVRHTRPSLVLMDVMMPRMDGYASTRAILHEAAVPIVMVSSVIDPKDDGAAMEALRAGALAIVEALPSPGDPNYRFRRGALIHLVRALAKVERAQSPEVPSPASSEPHRAPRTVIGIAASTGGPTVVAEILRSLQQRSLPPVLVVQHISRGFAEGFARWMTDTTGRVTEVATHGHSAQQDRVYIAPDDRHLEIDERARLLVGTGAPVGLFRPSANVLFASMARAFGARALGIVLTGMGEDGADGAAELRRTGAKLIVQDEESSVVYGMPRAALERGGADAVLPARNIPKYVHEWMQKMEPA